MKSVFMRLLVVLFLCSATVYSQDLQKGVVIPAVQLDESGSMSYALHLPNSYDESQQSPVVFVFDAKGQGAKAVQRFTIGSNLTNSVVVSPNYKMSDSLVISAKQTSALINTIYNNFSIDRSKLILAGEGRGALIASTSAHLTQDVFGVIAINDVFVDEKILNKNPIINFVILNNDVGSQYYKLKALDGRYSFREKLKGYYEFESLDNWPDEGYLAAAIVDLLQPSASSDRIEQFYTSDLAFGNALYKKRRHLEAFSFVSDLKKQYKKEVDLNDQKDLLREIRANSTYKASKLQRNTVIFEEKLLLEDFIFFLEEDAQKAYFDNLGWWNYQMDELDSTARNRQSRKVAKRLKSYVQKRVEEKHSFYSLNSGSLEQLLFINILRTLVDPNNQEAFVNVISLSAKEGDANAALFYLEELLRSGYTDYDSLYTIEGTTALRLSEDWNELVKAYLGKSKYYDN
jgi:hypothetical protein